MKGKRIMQNVYRIKAAICIMAASLLLTHCEKDPGPGVYEVNGQKWESPDVLIHDAVTDIDGNVYDAVKIGSQTWMAQNLRVIRYADGTSVLDVPYATYFVPSIEVKYGYLYNWQAVMRNATSSTSDPSGVQGLCPDGWHMPSESEWIQLTDYVSRQNQYTCGDGESDEIAKALADTAGWRSDGNIQSPGCYPHCNNITGFSAFPTGNQDTATEGKMACFWSATESGTSNSASGVALYYNKAHVTFSNFSKEDKMAIRCVKNY